MDHLNETTITKNADGKKLLITRSFDAPVEKIWRAWTEAALLDKWWAPRPWRAETLSMDFIIGGQWNYSMVGPDGQRSWNCVNYTEIQPRHSIVSTALFVDEQGNTLNSFPAMHWHCLFVANGAATDVTVAITFDRAADLEQIVAMGFKEGFSMGLGNLEALLANGF